MKGLMIVLLAFFSFNTFALSPCSLESQQEIDSLLSLVETAEDDMKRIDLEFEIKQISYGYSNCRKSPLLRGPAAIELPEMDVEVDPEEPVQDDSELDAVLGKGQDLIKKKRQPELKNPALSGVFRFTLDLRVLLEVQLFQAYGGT